MKWPFRASTADSTEAKGRFVTTFDASGAIFTQLTTDADSNNATGLHGAHDELALFLSQLEEEGFASVHGDQIEISWDSVFALLDSPAHASSYGLLGLPTLVHWRPQLDSRGALSDDDFAVRISGWISPEGNQSSAEAQLVGAILSTHADRGLVPRAVWDTACAVAAMYRRHSEEKGIESNRRAWALIRQHAVEAKADMSNFLRSTVVLTPERLTIKLRKGDSGVVNLVEVIPLFEGAPPRWMEIFDRIDQVSGRYEIPDGAGLTHVLVPPEMQTVLREIKRMPGRRIAGERAEAFVRNPFAALGPDAQKVIDPAQFEQARDDAGISFSRFTARALRDDQGIPYEVALLIEEAINDQIKVETLRFDSVDRLEAFIRKLEERISKGSQCCFWEGYELEILGDTPDQLTLLQAALHDWRSPRSITASEIFDLSRYSERVDGFGAEKPYYSPFIAKARQDGGWFPENVVFGISYTPEGSDQAIALALTAETFDKFETSTAQAKKEQRESFIFPGCPEPIAVKDAEAIASIFKEAHREISQGTFDPRTPKPGRVAIERRGLVVKANVETLDYEERRGALELPPGAQPRLPKSLKPDVALKEHQLAGLLWLQHLWSCSPSNCRGALLADDMGLGKTIQLLAFIASCLEADPDIDPFLIVAPVSLLENWKEEIGKFFEDGSMPVMTLYGSTLSKKYLPRETLEEELTQAGVLKLLTPGWIGNAKVVLTTYETLRDLEFSLAMQKWSGMICDEAQKIKNPNAMVSRAAKKQNARFKIACTGTPVENTLTDIWCLFDFMQPGLLGALKDFGERYRKPIEAETDEEKSRLEELKALIEPQKLRRMKSEVAKDLPNKTEVATCRSLKLSERQRAHYATAVGQFRKRAKGAPSTGLQSPLGLLQYLRRLCSDPQPPGQLASASQTVDEIERHSPKMAWLVQQLSEIRHAKEKAIVFCEFLDLQRTLQRVISERLGFFPDIINGSTSTAAESSHNRQRRIKAFQQKHGFGVIILSPLAVGFGVNIQEANHVIHFTRNWNPAKEDQATDRAYRIGQTKEVFVYYPVVVADDFTTFDAKLDKLLDWKRGLSTDMLNGAGDVSPSDFGDLEDVSGASAFGNEPLDPRDITSMDANTFEAFCSLLWNKLGFTKTYRTPRTGDGGIDVVALKGKTGALIQCKSSSTHGHELGWEAVKDVVGGAAAYRTRHPGVIFTLVAATNQAFNGTAGAQANLNHVELLDGARLSAMLSEVVIARSELDQLVFAAWHSEAR